jgi:predicted phosphoribosyltransferase
MTPAHDERGRRPEGKDMVFSDRRTAGRQLGRVVAETGVPGPVVVEALPRGGVPVGFEVATALDAPLDVILVRKLGVPFQPELAMGAIGEDGVRVLDPEMVRLARVSEADLERIEGAQRRELARQAERFRPGGGRVDLAGATAVVVDDGVATGSTARAACAVARAHGAQRIVLAVPVAASDVRSRLGGAADEVITLATPEPFGAVGRFYRNFSQVTDSEVVELLARAGQRRLDEVQGSEPA